MKFLNGFWSTLNRNIGESWGDVVTSGVEMTKTVQEFGKTLKEQAPEIESLKPYAEKIEPFLKAFDSPVTQLAVSGLPFLSIGVSALKLYAVDEARADVCRCGSGGVSVGVFGKFAACFDVAL